MHITNSATLVLMLFSLSIWYFHFLFMRKLTPAWPLFALECYSRWPLCRLVKHSSRLLRSRLQRVRRVLVCVHLLVEFWRCASPSLDL